MRECLLELDGTGDHWPEDQDERGFSFWQVAQIRPVNDEFVADGRSGAEVFNGYFLFADFLTRLWIYAIKLNREGDAETPIVAAGGESPSHVAGSFAEFVDLYLADSPRLYPP